MFINGEWIESYSKEVREINNPFNQEVVAKVTEGNKKDAVYRD